MAHSFVINLPYSVYIIIEKILYIMYTCMLILFATRMTVPDIAVI